MANARIVVVDDEPSIVEAVSWVLEEEGYDVSMARNGREGLDRIRAVHPDVIITDLMMPVMDGFALCRAVREDDATRSIPIVVMTAAVHLVEREHDLYTALLPKPFDLDGVLGVVEQVLAAQAPADARSDSSSG